MLRPFFLLENSLAGFEEVGRCDNRRRCRREDIDAVGCIICSQCILGTYQATLGLGVEGILKGSDVQQRLALWLVFLNNNGLQEDIDYQGFLHIIE